MSGDIPMIHGYEEQHGDERGNDKFDEVTWAELVRLREETRWHVELRITTRCPSCGHQSLFIGKGGHLTCSWLECKEPGLERAIEKLASEPSAPKLRVLLADAWWDGALYTGERSCHAMKQACDAMLREKVAQEEPTQANSAELIEHIAEEQARATAQWIRDVGLGDYGVSPHPESMSVAEAIYVDTKARLLRALEALSSSAPVERPPQLPQSEETEFWAVTVSRNGDSLVTIETNCLSGKPEFSDEDKRVIRMAANHLHAFIGVERGPEDEPFIPCDHNYVWVQETVLKGTQYRCDICGHVKWESAPAETQEERVDLSEIARSLKRKAEAQPSPETPATTKERE